MTGLKTVCPTCGSVDEENRALTEAVARMTRENAALRGQLSQHHRSGPDAEQVHEVFDYWKRTLGKRQDTVLGDARVKAIRARLKEGFTVERLKRAIDGCALDDWAMGRVRKTNGKTFNDIGKHICKSDETVEHFEAMTEKPPAPVQLRAVQGGKATDDPWGRPLDRALEALRREYGWDCYEPQWEPGKFHAESWWAPCPLHPTYHQPLRIRERGGHGGRLEFECVNKCLPSVIEQEVRRLELQAGLYGGVQAVAA